MLPADVKALPRSCILLQERLLRAWTTYLANCKFQRPCTLPVIPILVSCDLVYGWLEMQVIGRYTHCTVVWNRRNWQRLWVHLKKCIANLHWVIAWHCGLSHVLAFWPQHQCWQEQENLTLWLEPWLGISAPASMLPNVRAPDT